MEPYIRQLEEERDALAQRLAALEARQPSAEVVEAIRNTMRSLLYASGGTSGWSDVLLDNYETALTWLDTLREADK